jgi:spore coat protein CotF
MGSTPKYKTKGATQSMNINQMELQSLRHLIGSHETSEKKLNFYASQAQDPQVRQMFQQSAQSASQTRQKLLTFLG